MKPFQDTTAPPEVTTLSEVLAWQQSLRLLHARLARHFARPEPFARALRFVQGILSPVARKNGWQLAEHAGEARPDDEVDGRRGTVHSSDLPEIPSGGFVKTALFQPSLPEPDRRLSTHPPLHGRDSTGIGPLLHPPHPSGSV